MSAESHTPHIDFILSLHQGDIPCPLPIMEHLRPAGEVAHRSRPAELLPGEQWLELLVEEAVIQRELRQGGQAIVERFGDQPFIATWLPNGGYPTARAIQQIWRELGHDIPFFPLTIKRYQGQLGSKEIRIVPEQRALLELVLRALPRHGVVLIDDVFDRGITLETADQLVRAVGNGGEVRKILSMVLALKEGAQAEEVMIRPDFAAFAFKPDLKTGRLPWLGGMGMNLFTDESIGRDIDGIVALRDD